MLGAFINPKNPTKFINPNNFIVLHISQSHTLYTWFMARFRASARIGARARFRARARIGARARFRARARIGARARFRARARIGARARF